jgi:Family of unknown function (DUF6502)
VSEPTPPAPDAAASVSADQAALADALQQLLAPLARLAVAQGLPYAALDEMLRRSVVREAHAAHPELPEHRRVSRISAATGLNRREVSRLIEAVPRRLAPPQSTVTEVFTHWLNHPDYRGADGRPQVLPRSGEAPSFESLAQEINRDVHPRSFLEELLRLGLAEHDVEADTVQLSSRLFVPRDDLRQMFGFLGTNVGDHLAAAVDNVLHTGVGSKPHFEQAVFGEGLSATSVAALREALRGHWKVLLADLSLRIEAAVAADAADPAGATERVRFGLFSYHEPSAAPAAPSAAPARPPSGPKTATARAGRSRPRSSQERHDVPDLPDPSAEH